MHLVFAYVDVEEVGGYLEIFFGEGGGEGLPGGGGVEGLAAGLDGHREAGFVGLPFVEDGVGGGVGSVGEPGELESGDGGVAEVLVEEGSEVGVELGVPPGDDLVGGDVLIFEVLVEVVDEVEP